MGKLIQTKKAWFMSALQKAVMCVLTFYAVVAHAFQYADFDDGQTIQPDLLEFDFIDLQFGGGPYASWTTVADPLNPGGFVYEIEAITVPPAIPGLASGGGAVLTASNYSDLLVCGELVFKSSSTDLSILLQQFTNTPSTAYWLAYENNATLELNIFNPLPSNPVNITTLYSAPLVLNAAERYRFCLARYLSTTDIFEFWIWQLLADGSVVPVADSGGIVDGLVGSSFNGASLFGGFYGVNPGVSPLPFLQIDNLFISDGSGDADADGIADTSEASQGLNPGVPDSQSDFDNDGLTALQEQSLGTNPLLADTDDDGVNDGLEDSFGADPLDPLNSPLASKLLAGDGTLDDRFGSSVAIDGDTAIIGAPNDDDLASSAGSVYVFVRDSNGLWSEQQKLLASDAEAGDSFGESVAVDGDTMMIGANREGDAGSNAGAVYVFTLNNGLWTEQQKLIAADVEASDFFGGSVSIDGDTMLVGAVGDDDGGSASGAVYVYVRVNGVWSETQKLTANDGAAADFFGLSVQVQGNLAIVGSPFDDDLGSLSGSTYIFSLNNGVWSETQKLTAGDGQANFLFGGQVALFDDTAVVGSPGDTASGTNSGSAYVYILNGGLWSEQQKLLASDGAADDQFGGDVSIHDDIVMVGAHLYDIPGVDAGAAYIFVRDSGSWTEQQKLQAPDAGLLEFFGISVALDASTALIGASNNAAGSAYLFNLDVDEDGLLNIVETNTRAFVDENDTGTDPFNHDSDGDGLLDGEEVNFIFTNPNNPDTDGDGVDDGDEVSMGSDPLDINSVPVFNVPLPFYVLALLPLLLICANRLARFRSAAA